MTDSTLKNAKVSSKALMQIPTVFSFVLHMPVLLVPFTTNLGAVITVKDVNSLN